MNRVCKQVSIESPATVGNSREYVFQYDVMVPDVPGRGARVKVCSLSYAPCHFVWFLHSPFLCVIR